LNPSQIDYLLKHYKTKSVKEIAEALKMDRKEVQRELRRLLVGQAPRAAGSGRGDQAPRPGREPRPGMDLPPRAIGAGLQALLAAAVILATLALYWPSIHFPLVNWDDPTYITENRLIRRLAPANLMEIFAKPYFALYIPFTLLSYAIDYQWTLHDPTGYHLTNVLLHTANTALVYAVVAQATGSWLAALSVSLIFGVHPLQTESTVWIAERKNVLSSFFFLLSFLAYARSKISGKKGLFSVLALASFLAACFSKPNVVVAPLVFVAYDLTHGHFDPKRLGRYVPYFLVSLAFALVTVLITRGEGKLAYHGGGFAATMLTMTVVMMKYVELLVFPARQSLLYEFPDFPAPLPLALSLLGLLGIAAGLVWLGSKEKKLFFWGAWYFILLLPVMNLIPFPSLMNDRYLYLPMVGFFTLVFLLIGRKTGPGGLITLAVAAAAVFLFFNVKRQAAWAQPERLWLETQAKVKQEATAPYVNLGMHYLEKGDPDKAIGEFLNSFKVRETAGAHSGLGIAYFNKGDRGKAIEHFQKAVALEPETAAHHSNLARVYEAEKNYERAVASLKRAVELEPVQPIYLNNLGSVYEKMGELARAEGEFRRALEADPDHAESLYNLGLILFEKGEGEEAKQHWSLLLRVHPRHEKAAEVRSRLEAEENKAKGA
jgi:tetratricopeptide (TPR) repeat protein